MNAHILIVDDEKPIRVLLTRYLQAQGYTCCSAENGSAARRYLQEEVFDLLLCDLKMPGESGLSVIQHAQKHYPDMGRVVITSFDSGDIVNDVLTIGVYGYIIKPVTSNVVSITVDNALRHLRLDLQMNAHRVDLEEKSSLRTEKLSAIMDSLNVGLVMLDTDMKISAVNRKLQQYFPNIAVEQSKLCFHSFVDPPREELCGECPMMVTFSTGEPCDMLKRIVTVDGEKDFRVRTSPVRNRYGEIYAGIALYEDITEQLAMERDLQQAQKLESVGQLAAGIAHEINSPIQYVGDNIRFLQDSFTDLIEAIDNYDKFKQKIEALKTVDEEISQKLDKVIENLDLDYYREEIPATIQQSLEGVQRVDKIVRAMKEYSHPSGDKKTPMNINKIIESTVTVCRNEWKYLAKLSMNLSEDIPLIPCFAGEIGQVILNIIVNGAHAISDQTDGGKNGMGTLVISSKSTEKGVEIRMYDSGGGIPEHIQQRIFDPFFTTKAIGKGTGQGLAIAHRVITERHGGSLSFDSIKGKGTTFIIALPLAAS